MRAVEGNLGHTPQEKCRKETILRSTGAVGPARAPFLKNSRQARLEGASSSLTVRREERPDTRSSRNSGPAICGEREKPLSLDGA